MEARSAWTDERLTDRFDHIDSELMQLRVEMRQGFAELRNEIGAVRSDLGTEIGGLRGEIAGVRGEIAAVRTEISSFKSTMIRLYAAQGIAFLGVIAAFFARGG